MEKFEEREGERDLRRAPRKNSLEKDFSEGSRVRLQGERRLLIVGDGRPTSPPSVATRKRLGRRGTIVAQSFGRGGTGQTNSVLKGNKKKGG